MSSSTAPGKVTGAPAIAPCPRCAAATNGRFCSACGTQVGGGRCNSCETRLSETARYCHRCGTPAGAAGLTSRNEGSMIPWVVAGISVLALVVMLAMNRRGAPAAVPVADAESREVRPPDISQLSPRDAADRLFDRIMRLQEEGKRDSVNFFAPMASTAYAMVAPLDADARFHLGAIGIATGDSALARLALAQADTILAGRPTHLLGLVLGAQAAAALGDRTALRAFNRRLLDARGRELAQPLDEYLQHRPVIDSALRTARTTR